MRRKTFSIILALVMVLALMPQATLPSLAASGDVITFPDPNFEAAVREVIGKPTGDIVKGDVEGVTELDVSDKGIADLTGIEYFVTLEILICDNNNLITLDMNKNTALTELECRSNNLTALDVGKCTALSKLICYSNNLTALDVSKNAELSLLWCPGNDLTTLDVSKNTALTDIDCSGQGLPYGNGLSSLNVSKNIALETLQCTVNNLTELDVSKNTALTALALNGNKLTTLDVSNNTMLENLDCTYNDLIALDVSGNTELKWLNCQGNELTTLDVSNCVALTWLHCFGNNMPSKSAIIGLHESTEIRFYPQKVATTAPVIDSASEWAYEHIDNAKDKGFLTAEIQADYQAPVTRGEFVRLAMSWLNYYYDMTDNGLLAERGLERGSFSDTTDPVILAAAALGITAGVGDGRFGVDDQFNREQAAVMLTRVFNILGENTDNAPAFGFSDIDAANVWARDAINYVGSSGIMAGVGGNRFDPMAAFSREQSIIVFNKMG